MSRDSAPEYPSTHDNEGFTYQVQLLQYSCMTMRKLKYDTFEAAYEQSGIPKFDDVVCKFAVTDNKYQLLIQSKWAVNESKKITSEILRLSKDFGMKQYFKAILDIKKESIEGDRNQKFVILTNRLLHDNATELLFEDSSDDIIKDFFGEIVKKGAKIHQFKRSSTYIQDILKQMNIVESSEVEEKAKYIRENFAFVSNSPDLKGLEDLNEEIFMEEFQVTHKRDKRFGDFISKDIMQYKKIDYDKKTRKFLSKHNFENLLSNSIMNIDDVTKISTDFLTELHSDEVEFENEVLTKLHKRMKSKRIFTFECEESLKVNALKVYQCIKENKQKDVLFVPFSKLTHLQRIALKSFERFTVILMDEEEIPQDFSNNQFIFFIQKVTNERKNDSSLLLETFSWDELRMRTQLNFLHDRTYHFKLQMVEIDTELVSENYYKSKEIDRDLFVKWFNKETDEVLNFGRKLPTNRIPEVFIEREFYYLDNDKHSEKNYIEFQPNLPFIQNHRLTFVKGGPGMGKSSTLQKIAHNFKRLYSGNWIEFFELQNLSKYAKEAGNKIFTKIEAEEFLFEKLFSYGNDPLFERKLLKCYLCQATPPILLIFDGFDEIMPTYEEFFLNLIQQLSLLNIGIWVSGRLHCEEVVEKLTSFKEIYLENFDSKRLKCVVERYMSRKLILDCCSDCRPIKILEIPSVARMKQLVRYGNAFEIDFTPWRKKCCWCQKETNHKINETSTELDFFFKEVVDILVNRIENYHDAKRDFIKAPFFLKMFLDILIQDYKNLNKKIHEIFQQMENMNFLSIFNEIFDRSFEEYYEKEGVDPANRNTQLKKKGKMERVRKIYISFAIEELNLQDLLPAYFRQKPLDEVTLVIDVLGRGFVVQNDDKTLYFAHRTFAEYFVSEPLAKELLVGNNEVIKYFSEKKTENYPVKELTYHSLINNIKSEEIKTNTFSEVKSRFSTEFLKDLIEFCYLNSPAELSKVVMIVKTIITKDQRKDFQPEKLFSVLYEEGNRITFQHFSLFLGLLEQNSFDSSKAFLESHKDKVLSTIIIEDIDSVSLDKYNEILLKYNFSQENILDSVWKILNKIDIENVKSLETTFYWYFGKKCENPKDLPEKIQKEINDLMKNEINIGKINLFCFFIFFLNRFEFENLQTQKCLRNFWSSVKEKNRVYDFLSCFEPANHGKYISLHNDDNASYNVTNVEVIEVMNFVGECFKVLHEIGFDFMVTENCSILQLFFFQNQLTLFGQCLLLLPKEISSKLAMSFRNCDKILLNLEKKTTYNQFFSIQLFMAYLCTNFDHNGIEQCLKPIEYPSADEFDMQFIETLLRRDLNCGLSLTLLSQNKDKDDFCKHIVVELCSSALNWEKKHNLKLNFLHNVGKIGEMQNVDSKDCHKFYEIVLEFLNSENILLEKLSERDENDFIPLEAWFSECNFWCGNFFIPKFPAKIMLSVYGLKNKNGKIFFHFISNMIGIRFGQYFFPNDDERPEELAKSFSELLFQKDKDGKTPLHYYNLSPFADLIHKDHIEDLYTMKDQEGNNVFHYLASVKIDFPDQHFEYFRKLESLPHEVVKEILTTKNCEDQTPFEIACENKYGRYFIATCLEGPFKKYHEEITPEDLDSSE